MSPKLASAIVCIGIALGSLSAPKAPSSSKRSPIPSLPSQPPVGQSHDMGQSSDADSPLAGDVVTTDSITTLGSANASHEVVAETLIGTLPPARPDTNTFESAIQQ